MLLDIPFQPVVRTHAGAEWESAVRMTAVALAIAIAGLIACYRSNRRLRRDVRGLIGLTERPGREDPATHVSPAGAPGEPDRMPRSLTAMGAALMQREREILSRHDRLASQARRDRTLLEHASNGVALFDRELRILYTTPALIGMLGYPADKVIGAHATAFVHAADRDRAEAMLRDVAATPAKSESAVFQISTYGGGTRWFDAEISNLFDVPDIGAIVCRFRDVTEAREERARTRQSLDKLSRAIEQTADSVFITDARGVIEYVNPAFETMTGYPAAEAVGETPRILKSGRTPPDVYDALWRALTAGRVFRTTLVNKTRDGRLYDEDQTITPIRDASGAITHYVSTGRDVTQRKRAQEALLRLNHALECQATRFAGVLHDEAGQFLTAAHLTLADVSRGAAPELAGRLREVRHALVQIENRLRSLSHEIHPEVVSEQGLADAVSLCTAAFAQRTGVRVDITSSIQRRYPIAVEVVLYRLVQEALTNIHRHTAAECAWVSLAETQGMLHCSVRDNGGGFDASSLPAHRNGHLGLRLMQDRLEAVGGTLAIVSSPGQGTELRATIPVEV